MKLFVAHIQILEMYPQYVEADDESAAEKIVLDGLEEEMVNLDHATVVIVPATTEQIQALEAVRARIAAYQSDKGVAS